MRNKKQKKKKSGFEGSHLPASDAQQEAKHIGLLLLLKLFNVFEGTHLYSRWSATNLQLRKIKTNPLCLLK